MQHSMTVDTYVTRLQSAAAALDAHLKHLPSAGTYLSPDHTPPAPITEASILALLNDLDAYWEGVGAEGVTPYAVLPSLYAQALDAQAHIQVEDGELHRDYLECLPQDDNPANVKALFIHAGDEKIAAAGVLVFSHDDGRVLIYVPGQGVEGYTSDSAMLEALTLQLNNPIQRAGLLRHIAQPAAATLLAMAEDEDPLVEPFQIADLTLVLLEQRPFEQAIWALQNKQQADVIHALKPQANELDERPWLERVDNAIQMSGLLGLQAQMTARDIRLVIRQYAAQMPDWYKMASAQTRARLQALLEHSSQASAALDEALAGTASVEQYASLQLQRRLANDLGLDIDPAQVMIRVARKLPHSDEPYWITRSLIEHSIKGVHPGDDAPGSAFLTGSVVTLGDQPLPASHAPLTPGYILDLINELHITPRFKQVQRSTLGKASLRPLIRRSIDAQLMTQSLIAQMQGHITPEDYALIEGLDHTAQASARGPVTIQQVMLNGNAVLGGVLVLRFTDQEGQLSRLLMFTPDIAREQKVQGFDSERQLLIELVTWTRSPELRSYLLANTLHHCRSDLSTVLLQLKDKAIPAADFLSLINAGAGNFNDGLHALADLRINLLLEDQSSPNADWLMKADAIKRQELLALEDARLGAISNYKAKAHTAVIEYADYVHQRASEKIGHLTGQADGTVDPDQIIVTTPRETLTYTQMLRDGYDDSVDFFNGTADTTASFSGPQGVDLTLLTPEDVALSVRGTWLNDAYIALVRSTLLDPQSDGYAYRRTLSVLITQLSMQQAALRSLLKGDINHAQYRWLSYTLNTLSVQSAGLRARCPVFALQIPAEEPAAEFYHDTRQERGLPGAGSLKVETVQGCYVLPPKDSSNPEDEALLYTPSAPDGLAFRPLSRFVETLHNEGMGDYYKDRCRLVSRRNIALALHRLKTDPYPNPVILPRKPLLDMGLVCFDQPLHNKIRDIEDTTIGRSDMIEHQVWNAVELVVTAVTIWFPPASFAVGAAMAVRDGVKALEALDNGDHEAASLHVLGIWLNTAGAAGDAAYGLKGMGKLLERSFTPSPVTPSTGSGSQGVSTLPVALNGQPFWLRGPTYSAHASLLHKNTQASQTLLPSGRYAHKQTGGTWSTSESGTAAQASFKTAQANPSFEVPVSLDNAIPANGTHANGVVLQSGKHYIQVEGKVFEVQFDAKAGHWNIVNPQNPFAFFGKQPVIRDAEGNWNVMEPATLRGGSGRHSRLPAESEDSSASPRHERLTRFEFPAAGQKHMFAVMDTRQGDEVINGQSPVSEFHAHFVKNDQQPFSAMRADLYQTANRFFENGPQMAAKHELPQLDGPVAASALFQGVFASSNGLVLSETLSNVGSKKFLIENMQELQKQGVEVIYLRSLLSDSHAGKLKQGQKKTLKKHQRGSQTIKDFLGFFEKDHHGLRPDSLDYYHLIKEAHIHGIEVKAFSSCASYDLPDAVAVIAAAADPHAAKKMSTFFGNEIIELDKLTHPDRRWVALLDHDQANMHERLPGIAELQGVVSIRIEDVATNRTLHISRDLPADGEIVIRSDFKLEVPSPDIAPSTTPLPAQPKTALPAPIDYDLLNAIEGVSRREANAALTRRGSNQLAHYTGNYGYELDNPGKYWRKTAASQQPSQELTPIQQSLQDTNYEIPQSMVQQIHHSQHYTHRGLHPDYRPSEPLDKQILKAFHERRRKLSADAHLDLKAILPVRPALPAMAADTPPGQVLDQLYQTFDGVIVGEQYLSIVSKKLIIDNMGHLANSNVKTLYVEGLHTDIHQADLDRFFETGYMSKILLRDIKKMETGVSPDISGQYTFENLLITARQHRLEVRALDCAASQFGEGRNWLDTYTRDRLFAFFAPRVIRRHQNLAGPHKWLALMEASHASAHSGGIPGVAERQGAAAVRVVQADPGRGSSVQVDMGERVSRRFMHPEQLVRNDLKLELELPSALGEVFASKLKSPYTFSFDDRVPGRPVIAYRSSRGPIEGFAVRTDGEGRLFINVPKWGLTPSRRFNNRQDLINALKRLGLMERE